MAYVALLSGRSLHGNHVGAPCGWAATMTPSVSSSQPASSRCRALRVPGEPAYFTRSSNSWPAASRAGIRSRLPRWVNRAGFPSRNTFATRRPARSRVTAVVSVRATQESTASPSRRLPMSL